MRERYPLVGNYTICQYGHVASSRLTAIGYLRLDRTQLFQGRKHSPFYWIVTAKPFVAKKANHSGAVKQSMAQKSQAQQFREQQTCKEVAEIKEMFAAIERSLAAIPDKSGILLNRLVYDGFDGNNESEHARIAGMNSHMPRLNGYMMLVQRWNESADKQNLTKQDLLRIGR